MVSQLVELVVKLLNDTVANLPKILREQSVSGRRGLGRCRSRKSGHEENDQGERSWTHDANFSKLRWDRQPVLLDSNAHLGRYTPSNISQPAAKHEHGTAHGEHKVRKRHLPLREGDHRSENMEAFQQEVRVGHRARLRTST